MKIIYFYHIPKCGGSYVYNLFQKFCQKINGELVPFINLSDHKKDIELDNKLKGFIRSLKDYSSKEVLFIHHHHGYPGIHELHDEILKAKEAVNKNGDEMIVISTVRDPLSFSISRVNYMQKKGHEIQFKDLIDESYNHNMISKYLLYNIVGRWKSDSVQIDIPLVESAVSIFDRIFLMNEMDQLTLYLNKFLNTKGITIKEKINAGDFASLPTDEETKNLLELNRLDQHFYDFVKDKNLKEVKLVEDQPSVFKKLADKLVKILNP